MKRSRKIACPDYVPEPRYDPNDLGNYIVLAFPKERGKEKLATAIMAGVTKDYIRRYIKSGLASKEFPHHEGFKAVKEKDLEDLAAEGYVIDEIG